jgi:nucleoside-diphosphate-sugar epimerase
MPRRVPDISKIRTAIGWEPTRTLDDVLTDVVRYQQEEAAVV